MLIIISLYLLFCDISTNFLGCKSWEQPRLAIFLSRLIIEQTLPGVRPQLLTYLWKLLSPNELEVRQLGKWNLGAGWDQCRQGLPSPGEEETCIYIARPYYPLLSQVSLPEREKRMYILLQRQWHQCPLLLSHPQRWQKFPWALSLLISPWWLHRVYDLEGHHLV